MRMMLPMDSKTYVKNFIKGVGSVLEIAPVTHFYDSVPHESPAARISAAWDSTGCSLWDSLSEKLSQKGLEVSVEGDQEQAKPGFPLVKYGAVKVAGGSPDLRRVTVSTSRPKVGYYAETRGHRQLRSKVEIHDRPKRPTGSARTGYRTIKIHVAQHGPIKR